MGLKLKDKALDAGSVPLNLPQTVTAQLRNSGTRTAVFRVLPNAKLQVGALRRSCALVYVVMHLAHTCTP